MDSPVNRHLGCFHVLAIVNSATMNIGVHVSFQTMFFSRYMPRNGIAGSYGSYWVIQGCGPSVIKLTSFLWLWFQCVCPLMPSCNTYHLTWVSLTLDVGYLFMAAPAKCSCCSLPWTRGISSLPPLPTLNWNSSSRPSSTVTATDPWTWGCSSRLPPLASGRGSSSRPLPLGHGVLPASAPELGCGVASLGRALRYGLEQGGN